MIKKSGFILWMCVFGLFLSAFSMNATAPITGTPPPLTGDWVINDDTVVTDENVVCEGSIIINSGGNLTLDGSTVKLNCATDGQYGIDVKSGGEMHIKGGSTIDKHSVGNYYFIVNDGASLEMKDSTLKYCGYENENNIRHTGLYIDGDGLIEHCTIDVCCQGVIAENCTITIKDSTITRSLWHNIVGRNVDMTLDNNTISWAEKMGVWVGINSDLTIKDCHVHNSTRSGIWVDQDSEVECYKTKIAWNGNESRTHWDTSGHGFAGFDSDVYFHNNTVSNNWGHNFETTRCSAMFNDNHFDQSIKKCNVEFFDHSVVTAKRNYIDGAGHNCFWVRDGVTATIEECTMKNSPHNGIWAGNQSTMIIKNNIIENCAESGIYSYNSTLEITNNEIKNCKWWGIHTEGCTVTQSGNTYTSVTKGQVHEAYFITLKAVDEDGKPIQGATITVKDSAGTQIWTGTTDTNGETQHMILSAQKTDTGGASTTYTYTVEAKKGDMSSTTEITPTKTDSVSLTLKSEEEEDNLMMIVAIIIVVILVVIVLVAIMAKKKGKKEVPPKQDTPPDENI
ncbi:MAG: right-handed parallel beta-helix repeat-containing protein [Thermoplasmata archaeon]|nr:MAG: right-handed parallel beta-helix repeat-containing protein [Thermoplasmata archaeon]